MFFDVLQPTSAFLLHAELPLQGLSELPLSDQLHLQLRPLQLVLLLLRPRVLYGNPQKTLLGDTETDINRLHTPNKKPGGHFSPNHTFFSGALTEDGSLKFQGGTFLNEHPSII